MLYSIDLEVDKVKKLLAILLAILMATSLISVASADRFISAIAMNDTEIAAITGSYYDQVIMAARFKDGLVATMTGGKLGYFVDGEAVMFWEHEITEEDFFFYVKDVWPDANYDLCVVLGDSVYSINDDLTLRDEVTDLYYYDFDFDFAYFFAIRDGSLYYWSPYAYVLVANNGVYDMIVTYDYAFFDDATGGHAINASLIDMNRMKQRYFMYHPLRIVDLGTDFWNCYGDVYGWSSSGRVREDESFDQRFGIDFSEWGNPKYDFTVEDFVTCPDMTVSQFQRMFDAPIEDYENPIRYADINFYGHSGFLAATYKNEATFRQISWTSDAGSIELTEELKGIIGDRGSFVKHNSFQDDHVEEDVYEVDGQMIHVGYQDIDGKIISFIYANNKYLTDE